MWMLDMIEDINKDSALTNYISVLYLNNEILSKT